MSFYEQLRALLRKQEERTGETLDHIAADLRVGVPAREKLRTLAAVLDDVPDSLQDAASAALVVRSRTAYSVVVHLHDRLEHRVSPDDVANELSELARQLRDGAPIDTRSLDDWLDTGTIGPDCRNGGVLLPSAGPWAELEKLGFTILGGAGAGRIRADLPEQWAFEPKNRLLAHRSDARGIRRVTAFFGGAVEECVLHDVGARLAEGIVFDRDLRLPALPEKWPELTRAERANFIGYLAPYAGRVGAPDSKTHREDGRALVLLEQTLTTLEASDDWGEFLVEAVKTLARDLRATQNGAPPVERARSLAAALAHVTKGPQDLRDRLAFTCGAVVAIAGRLEAVIARAGSNAAAEFNELGLALRAGRLPDPREFGHDGRRSRVERQEAAALARADHANRRSDVTLADAIEEIVASLNDSDPRERETARARCRALGLKLSSGEWYTHAPRELCRRCAPTIRRVVTRRSTGSVRCNGGIERARTRRAPKPTTRAAGRGGAVSRGCTVGTRA